MRLSIVILAITGPDSIHLATENSVVDKHASREDLGGIWPELGPQATGRVIVEIRGG